MSYDSNASEYRMLIGGQLVEGASTMPVVNPATGEAFAICPRASVAQADAAIEAAKEAFGPWSALSVSQRQAYLVKLADAVEKHQDDLARLLTQEQGKPLAEALWEVQGSAAYLRHFSTMDLPEKVIEESADRRVVQQRRPLGVVVAIVPWNFPVLLLNFKLPAALLAGNTMVVKPSPTTPLTTLRFGEICSEILPAGVVNIVADNNDLGAHLTAHPDVRKISFTGSTPTGSKIMASAAGSLKRITLELGGNDAAIVLGDVDPAQVAPALFGTAFMNCGQVCVAIKRLYVHDSIYDRMCDELAALANATQVGDGLEAGTQMGPLQNRAQFEKVKGMLDNARKCGTVVAGGEIPDRPGYFMRPTIVRDVTDGDLIVDEEQFGPILPVIRYTDPEDALRRANASPMGLGGSVWGNDHEQVMSLASRMDTGMVWVNKHLDIGPHIPFGGAKQSGIGVESNEEGLAEFTQLHIINAAP